MASSSNDDDDGQGYSDFDEEDTLIELDSDDEISPAVKQNYQVLTEDAVRKIQEERIATVADLIQVPPAFAALVLRHCNWSSMVVQDRWFSDERRVREAVGLPSSGIPVAVKRNVVPLTCALCFDEYSPGQMRSAGCDHFYCRACWRGYLHAAVEDGARCLSLRCPDPSCSAPVVRDLYDVADEEDRRRYDRFALRSYVEESKRMRWCPSPRGCPLAVEYLDGEQCKETLDVVCSCGHGFCILCAEEAHRPVTCGTVREWMAKNSSESETTNWVLANAKHCPKCRRPIEKSSGCNHMTCSSPCRHEFCWLCLGDWRPHVTGVYKCNRYDVDVADHRREQAQASLDRYLHYYERWAAHELSRQRARDDMFELESALAACGADADEAHTQIGFLMDAYTQILEGRRMLRWTYAYGFYAEGAKLTLLECLQGEAEASLERLHGFAELERNSTEMDFDGGVSYFKTLAKLTKQTANYFESMAEAFQTDLA
ncbi:hypothetical protein QYE76_049610 [Lolium multiflorum]|uniref:RBR-type E3 ubiquitin transferase n=1 Tax=Lolium multiflorum TaxID=4521 RepID=A0AAD8WH20_LOLMU|nr:hypothetical protein QYE76_049610 [Lolium multiflorum]